MSGYSTSWRRLNSALSGTSCASGVKSRPGRDRSENRERNLLMATIIDVHAHYYPPAYLTAVSKLGDLSGPAGKAARLTVDHPLIHRNPLFTGAFDRRLAL